MKDINIYELKNPVAFNMLKTLIDIYPMHWKRILINMSLPKKNTANIDVN